MVSLWTLVRREPALVVGLIDAGLVLGTTFGLHLSAAQTGAIDSLLALVSGLVIRSQVSPVASLPAPADTTGKG